MGSGGVGASGEGYPGELGGSSEGGGGGQASGGEVSECHDEIVFLRPEV